MKLAIWIHAIEVPKVVIEAITDSTVSKFDFFRDVIRKGITDDTADKVNDAYSAAYALSPSSSNGPSAAMRKPEFDAFWTLLLGIRGAAKFGRRFV